VGSFEPTRLVAGKGHAVVPDAARAYRRRGFSWASKRWKRGSARGWVFARDKVTG